MGAVLAKCLKGETDINNNGVPDNKELIIDVEKKYNIEKELLLALMGIETNFGKYVGKMDILSSLATLSFDKRRSEFFTNELITLLQLIEKKRFLLPLPLPIAELSARFFEILPNPLLTRDQLRLLKYDNIASGKYKTNFDIGFKTNRLFSDEIEKYSFNWRDGGQYTK